MKYYHKYQEALEAAGYRVDEHGYVWDSAGNQSAGEDNYGNVQSKDANVTAICIEQDEAPLLAKLAKKVKPKKAAAPRVRNVLVQLKAITLQMILTHQRMKRGLTNNGYYLVS